METDGNNALFDLIFDKMVDVAKMCTLKVGCMNCDFKKRNESRECKCSIAFIYNDNAPGNCTISDLRKYASEVFINIDALKHIVHAVEEVEKEEADGTTNG